MIKAQIYTEDIFSVYMIYSNGECIDIEYLGDTFIPITSSECYIKP